MDYAWGSARYSNTNWRVFSCNNPASMKRDLTVQSPCVSLFNEVSAATVGFLQPVVLRQPE
jgi:hypothetical protein